MAERGIVVTYEAIGQWCRKFGPAFAAALRRRRPGAGDKWHVDEVQLKMKGRRYWLWRAVDQDRVVLDILVQERRSQAAAETFFWRLVNAVDSPPRVVVTGKLASYPPALRERLPRAEHRRHKGVNNHAENSHQPTRRREWVMQRFKSPEQAQRFLSAFGPIRQHVCPRRHLLPAPGYRQLLASRFETWCAIATPDT